MRRLPSAPLPTLAPPRTAAVPAALLGGLALALVGEHAAVAASPAPALAAVPPAPTARAAIAPLPAAAAAADTYVVADGDTVYDIAERHGLDTATVLAANGLDWSSIIRPGQTLLLGQPASAPAAPTAPAADRSYEVRAGDTVSAIAAAHGTTVDAVLAANGLERSSIIYPGETLRVPAAGDASLSAAPAPAPATAPGLDGEQSDNARLIIRIGRELGVPDRGILIALGTAMQESWLRNLEWGDRDSLGLFQQRPSTGWGSREQILDRDRATRVFYGGAGDPNGTATRGLLDIPGWQDMPYADAAQSVQISAFPDRYAQWEQPATTWMAVLG